MLWGKQKRPYRSTEMQQQRWVPSWQSQCSACDCMAWRSVSNNHCVLLWQREKGHHSPSLGCDEQERDVASSRAVNAASESVQELFLSAFLPKVTILSLHCSSSLTSRLSRHWHTARQLACNVPFSLHSCSCCQFCLCAAFLAH